MTKCTEGHPVVLHENNFSELLTMTSQNAGNSSTSVDGNDIAPSLATVVMETSNESPVIDGEGSSRCNVIVTSQSLTPSSTSQTTSSQTVAANGPMPLSSSSSSLPTSSSSSSSSYSSPSSTTTGSGTPPSEGPPATSCVTSSDDAIGQSNLIVNYLPAFMSQDDVRALFESMGQLESCKLVRDKNTGHSLGYGFVKFKSKESAKSALKAFNGLRIQNKTIKVSYARPSSDVIKGANLYISGLSPDVTPNDLTELFAKYGSIISVRILSDSVTGLSKGVSFIRFDLRSEAEAAVSDLNGKVVFGAPITVKFASQPAVVLDTRANQNHHSATAARPFTHHPYLGSRQSKSTSHDSNNDSSFTLHVHNLPASTSDSDVWSLFGPMGTVKSVKVIRDKVTGTCKGHALVSMPDPEQARSAVNLLNGLKFIGGNLIQVQLKGQKSKHSESQKPPQQTLQDAARHQQLQQQQQQQQVFLQRQQLSFTGANAIQQVQHFPVILQQNSATNDNNNNLSQKQQQQQQHQLHLQQNFQLPAQLALHSATPTALPGAILAHPAFYPAVIDASFVPGIQSTDFSNPNIFLSAASGSIVGQNQLSSINIPPSGGHQVSGFTTHPSMGSYPITILHDI